MADIEHVLIIVKENHTFDNYFAGFPALAPGDPSGDMWECFDFEAPPRLGPPGTVRQ